MKHDWQDDLIFTSQSKRLGYGMGKSLSHSLDVRLRVRAVWGVFVIGMALIASKIIYLQIVERGQHELTSYSNHVELVREPAPRGIIYDRSGVALVVNKEKDGRIEREYPMKEAISARLRS